MTGSVRSVQAGESGATPQDAEALLDELPIRQAQLFVAGTLPSLGVQSFRV